jgi:Holliday junction resolvasome RuvABC DNA-binding subunit
MGSSIAEQTWAEYKSRQILREIEGVMYVIITHLRTAFFLKHVTLFTEVMKHEYEDSLFLFVIILPILRSVKKLI